MSTFSWSQWILSWLLLVFSLIAYALFCILFSHPFQMGGGLYYRCRAMFFTEFMLNGWSMGSWDKTCGTQYKKFLGRRFIRWSQNIYIYRYKAQKIKKKIEARQEKERNMFVSEVNVQMLYRTDVISKKSVYIFLPALTIALFCSYYFSFSYPNSP